MLKLRHQTYWNSIQRIVLWRPSLLPVLFLLLTLATNLKLQAQCTPVCNSALSIALGSSGEAVITVELGLANPACDPADFSLAITDENGAPLFGVLDCSQIGQILNYSIVNIFTGNSCGGTIILSDNFSPNILCQDTTIWCIESATPEDIGYPTVVDNCSNLDMNDLSYTDVFYDLTCFTNQGGDSITSRIERTWSVTDDAGNTGVCVQNIYFKRATLNDIMLPLNRDDVESPSLDCLDDPSDFSLTGAPSLAGMLLTNSTHCELLISSSDQVLPACSPNSVNILRTWTLLDECNGEFVVDVQLIKLKDKTPPVLSCPANLVVGTTSSTCGATINLPAASATDDCSSVTIVPSWAFGNGYGPFDEVPIGVHNVAYIAEDECGNKDTCQMTITVVDDVTPLAACAETLEISLTNIGTAILLPTAVNSASTDNCGIDYFELSRDGVTFTPFLSFDCTDIAASPIPVHLRVYDTAGNFSSCSSSIQVADNIYPLISCPADVTIACVEDYEDLGLTGVATSTDNCSIDTIYFTDQLNLNTCNTGSVERTWTTVDTEGNEQICTQWIYLEDTNPMTVQFPPEFISYTCGTSVEESITGSPIIMNGTCKDVGISHTDNFFNLAAPACYTILRNWVVVEWCSFDPNSGTNEGYWTYTQIIRVLDNEAPVVDCPENITVEAYANDCAGTYVTIAPVTGMDCNPNLSITNNSPYAEEATADASGIYPVGVHLVEYEVSDECGNISTCEIQVTVVDRTNPSVICITGLVANLTEGGTVELTSAMLDYGSMDNCSAPENLSFEVQPSSFDCDDVGFQNVSLLVTDEAGNTATCVTVVEIQDNGGNCPTVNISGGVEDANGVGLAGVEFNLSGDETNQVTTDFSGQYTFEELVPGGNFTITPRKDTLPRNGITTFDLIIITKHLLHIENIDSPYKQIAADVNRSGHISIFDVIDLRKFILFLSLEFPNNTSWRFVESSYVFPNPTNPFQNTFPESFSINSLYENLNNSDFIGIKVGDIDCSANPNALTGAAAVRNTEGTLRLEIEDQLLQVGEEYLVPVYANEFSKILGCQFTLGFPADAIEIVDIETGTIADIGRYNFGWHRQAQGTLGFSWNRMSSTLLEENPILFYLKLKSKKRIRLREALWINSEMLVSEAYAGDRNFELEALQAVQLQFKGQEVAMRSVRLLQNTPNPFHEQTTIAFELGEATEIQLDIYNAAGKLMKQIRGQYPLGWHEVTLRASDLAYQAGVYYYHLQTKTGKSKIQKMIFLH